MNSVVNKTLRNFRIAICKLILKNLIFFLAGLSSYLDINLLIVTDTSTISFVPQGIALLFYGTGGIGIAVYLFLTIFGILEVGTMNLYLKKVLFVLFV